MALPIKRITRKIVRFFIWLIGGIIVLLIVLVILIQIPAVQEYAKQKAVTYLQRKLGTRVALRKLRIIFPKQILLEGLYLEDQHHDTLLAGSRIQVDISMFALLHHEISISHIDLDSIRANVYRHGKDTAFNYAYILKAFASAPDTTHRSDTSGGFTFSLGDIGLHHIVATYVDDLNGQTAYVNLGQFSTRIKTFDPAHGNYAVSPIAVGDLVATYAKLKMRAALNLKGLSLSPDTIDLTHNRFVVKTLALDSTSLSYDDDTRPRLRQGVDYNHLAVTSLVIRADGIGVSPTAYSGNIRQLAFSEQSGLHVQKLVAALSYSDKEAHVKGLVLQTDKSRIQLLADARYPSIDTLSKHLGLLYMNARIDPSTISARDLLLMVPSLAAQLKGNEASSISLGTVLSGRLDDLTIAQFDLRGLLKTSLSVKGHIKGLPNGAAAFYDLNIGRLVTDSADIAGLLPSGTLPSTLHMPKDISVRGRYVGTINFFHTDVLAQTTDGNAQLDGQMDLRRHSYQGKVSLTAMDLGYILGQSALVGKFTLSATAQGQGFSYPQMETDVTAKIAAGEIKGYNYQNLSLSGHFHQGKGTVHSDIDDPALQYQLDATAQIPRGGKYPAVHMTLQLDTLDAGALHLVADTLQASGLLRADFANTNPDSLDGNLDLLHGLVRSGSKLLRADSIALVASHPLDSQYIHLYSDMAVLDWKGHYALTKTPQTLEAMVNRYYPIPGFRDTVVGAAQDWDLHLLLRPSDPLVLTFVPALKGTDTVGVHATLHRGNFALLVQTPRFLYGADTAYALKLSAETQDQALDYRLQLARAGIGGIPLNQTAVYGDVAGGKLFTTVLLKDGQQKDWYRIAAQIAQGSADGGGGGGGGGAGAAHTGGGFTFSLNPDSLLLNHTAWTVSRDNAIHYDSTGVIARDLEISHQGQSLKIASLTQNETAPLQVTFTDFHLGTLTAAAGQDSLQIDGTLNGQAQVSHIMSGPVFTSDLTIKDLSYQKDTLGDLTLKVNNEQANTYAADISLEGHLSDLKITGKYTTGEGKIDMNLHLGALNLAAAKPFAAGQLDDIKGILKGDMHITGTASQPVPDGNLHFENALIAPHITGEALHLSNDNIEFDNTGFNFSKFTLQDSAGNKATVDGNVYTTDFRNYKFDMTFNANNFRLVNAPQATDRLFYGKLNMDAAVNLEGDPGLPKIDGDVRINRKTDFTFVLPENDPEVVNRNGVVRFVDKNHPLDTVQEKMALDSISAVTTMTGMNISANIATDSSANFTMVIDQRNGDALKVRGRSALNFGMDESGKTTLTGNYEIDAGSYSLTLDVLKRNFLIQRGSTITWTGDPTSAQLDLTALYLANTAPIDLVEDELAGSSPAETNKYKQKLPFTVSLMMKGELLKPVITFDINLPNNLLLLWPEVDTKLQQVRSDPSELNKQVFALLLLGRFVGDNPLENGAGGTSVGQMAFQSASQILTGELNQLAGSLIKGVDVSFDLNNTQDYSTGQEQDQTDLGVTVSKRLFNDRIKVNVGSDFELAGTLPGQNASNIGGDLSVDYQLTKDGRYMLRAYRKNQYDVVVEGEVVETGLSFILTLDYDKFSEIFGKYLQSKLQARKIAHGS